MDINSVLIYLAIFGISIACIFLSEHIKGSKLTKSLLTFIAVFVICIFAALRDPSVGADVEHYLVPNYKHALSIHTGFWHFYNTLPIDNEILFALLIYFFAKIGNYTLLCFTIELLVVCPVIYVLKKENKKVSVTLGYTLFLLLFVTTQSYLV